MEVKAIVLKKSNELSLGNFSSRQILPTNVSSISELTNNLMNDTFYSSMIDIMDVSAGYSIFDDIEMIYLFVHTEKDINEENHKVEDTKKEYIRDLLIFYKQLLDQHELFEINIPLNNPLTILGSLTERNLRKYQEWLAKAPFGKGGKPYSIATLNRKLSIIKGFFRFLFQCKYISKPMAENIKNSNVRKHQRPDRDMSSVEVIELLKYYKSHPILYSLYLVLATTGLRIRELCTARVCDITMSNQGEYWLKVQGKGRKEREVLLHKDVMDSIYAFRLRRRLETILDGKDSSPLFTTAAGKPYSYKYLSRYLTKKANQVPAIKDKRGSRTPITPHFFRHYFAIESAELEVDLLKISQTLGHESISTTEIYLAKHLARKNNAAHAWKNSSILNNL